jgi:hypothetical protein
VSREDVHKDLLREHDHCPDPARCECECRTCKRAWFAAGQPLDPDKRCPNGHPIGKWCGTQVCNLHERLSVARRYRSDDRDLYNHDNDLLVFQGENGDWYISIVKHGEKLGPSVRLTTSGTPRGYDRVPAAMMALYRALPEPTDA